MIGFVHYLFHRSTARLGSVCYLQDMFTVEIARGRGVGRAMIEAVGVRARPEGQVEFTGTRVRQMPPRGPSTTRSRHSPNSFNIARTCERWSRRQVRCRPARGERTFSV